VFYCQGIIKNHLSSVPLPRASFESEKSTEKYAKFTKCTFRSGEAVLTIYCGSVKYGQSFEMNLVEKSRSNINK